MKKINQLTVSFGLTALFSFSASAQNKMKYVESAAEDSAVYYYNVKSNTATKIDVSYWKSEFAKNSGEARGNFLRRLYAATTRILKDNGERHAVCFLGSADELVEKFFAKEVKISGIEAVKAIASEDQKTIGVTIFPEEQYAKLIKKPYWHFRMNHCNEAGKNHYFDLKKAQVAKVMDFSRLPAQVEEQLAGDEERGADAKAVKAGVKAAKAAAVEPLGFQILDKPSADETAQAKKLPRFKMRADYQNIKVRETDRPWKGLDLNNDEDKMKFARTTLYYFFKGMADQSPKADSNFIAEKNKKADWCQMPWLNVGDSGREYVHGLTKERDLEPSTMYPQIEEGSDWGIGYYNSHGCVTLGKIFGGSTSRLEKPAFYEHKFENGTMSAKILFTTSPSSYFDGSFTLTAHVSNPGSNFRRLQKVRMLQIDIAVKDNEIKGTSPIADHWVMTSYYYDPTFTWDFANEFKNPEVAGLMHMRPIGTHTGFDSATSYIFPGAKTNSNSETWGRDKLLNGPADNPKSSCMGCHGTAGGSYSGKYKMVPGILDFPMYEQFKLKKHMDFSQQLGFAKRNFDTQPQKK